MDISELVRRWPPHVIKYLMEEPRICEDCGNVTDLGHKCRACYVQWQRLLYQDIPLEYRMAADALRELQKCNEDVRKAIAHVVIGEDPGMVISAYNAELVTKLKRVMDGPFKDNIEATCRAIASSTASKAKPRGRLDD